MSRIRINVSRVKSILEDHKINITRLANVHSEIRHVRSRLDPKILARNNIGTRLRAVEQDIQDAEQQLRDIFSVIDQGSTKYANLERYLVEQLQHITRRTQLATQPPTSDPEVDYINWSQVPENMKPQLAQSIRLAPLLSQFRETKTESQKNTPEITKYPEVDGVDWSKVPENMKQQVLDSIRHAEQQKYKVDGIDWDKVSPSTEAHLRNSLDLAAQQRGNQRDIDSPSDADDRINEKALSEFTLREIIQNNPDSYPYDLNSTGFHLSQQYYLAWYYGTEAYNRLDAASLSHHSYLAYSLDKLRKDGIDLSSLTVEEIDKMCADNAGFWFKASTLVVAAQGTYSAYLSGRGMGNVNSKGMGNTAPKKHSNRNIKDVDAMDDINNFLGSGKQTDINPFTGKKDPDRIFVKQKDGSVRAVRIGDHETRTPNNQHYHLEQWDSQGNFIRPDQSVKINNSKKR